MARAMHNRMYWAGSDPSSVHQEPLPTDVICRVRRAGAYALDASWRLPERITPMFVLFMINSGTARFTEAGRRYDLAAGQCLLTTPHVVQAGESTSSDLTLHVVHFTAQSRGLPDAPPLAGLPRVITLDRAHRRAQQLARRIVDGLAGGGVPGLLAANGGCAQLVAELWRSALADGWTPSSSPTADSAALDRLGPALTAIRERYDQSLSVAELADLLHLHPTYFTELFRRALGLSPGRYLSHVRLAHARELLVTTDLGLEQVAARTGHGSASYLSRVFRAVEGVPPGDYRRAERSAG